MYSINLQSAIYILQSLCQQWKEHFKWSEDATEIIGITPEGQTTISALNMNRPQMIRVRKMWVKLREHPPTI